MSVHQQHSPIPTWTQCFESSSGRLPIKNGVWNVHFTSKDALDKVELLLLNLFGIARESGVMRSTLMPPPPSKDEILWASSSSSSSLSSSSWTCLVSYPSLQRAAGELKSITMVRFTEWASSPSSEFKVIVSRQKRVGGEESVVVTSANQISVYLAVEVGVAHLSQALPRQLSSVRLLPLVDSILPMMKHYAQDTAETEVESRIGYLDQNSGEFVSGMSRQDFELAVENMWSLIKDQENKEKTQDFALAFDSTCPPVVESVKKLGWRTRINFFWRSGVRAYAYADRPDVGLNYHEIKVEDKVDFFVPGRQYQFRIARKLEKKRASGDDDQNFGPPSLVRIKDYVCFNYRNEFQYSFAKVRSGADKERALASTDFVYELEIELLPGAQATQTTAVSFLEKTLDFVIARPFDLTYMPQVANFRKT